MKTDIKTWKRHFRKMRDDWEIQHAKTGDAAFAALEMLMPGLERMWYDLRDCELSVRDLKDEIDRLKSELGKESS